jgi:hypothetical protein
MSSVTVGPVQAIRRLAKELGRAVLQGIGALEKPVESPWQGVSPEPEFLVDIEGRFWSADSPDRKVRGRLQWTAQTGELRLEQILRVVPQASTDKIGVIHGNSLLGEPMCLTDCFVHSTRFPGGQYPQSWTVNGTLLGVESPQSTVEGLQVHASALRPFYGEPLVDVRDDKEGPRDVLDIRWKSSPEVRVKVGSVSIVFDDDWRMDGPVSGLKIQARPRLRLLSDGPVQQSELEDVLGPLILLCGICGSGPVDIQEMHLLLPGGEAVRTLTGHRPVAARTDSRKAWLALGNLDPLDRTVPAWMSLYREMPKALTMLAEYHRAGPDTPWEDRLLYLARFIEQYHRKRHESLRMPKADFRARRKKARDTLGGELGAWVYELSEHANERSLAERLQELVDDLRGVIADVLPDPAAFGKKVADTRNYYTHYSDYLASRAAKEMDLVLLTKQLWIVIKALLLREMGYDPAQSRARLEFDPDLAWLVGAAREAQ